MTNNSKDALNSLMEGIEYVVQSQIKSAPFDKIKNGKIVAKNIDGTYEVSIENQLYSVPPLSNKDLPNGSIVKVVIPQNNYSHMFILTVGNEVPSGTADYLDLENRLAVNGRTLVGNQTAADLGITGSENAIETSKANGVTQTVTNKAVDINGHITAMDSAVSVQHIFCSDNEPSSANAGDVWYDIVGDVS